MSVVSFDVRNAFNTAPWDIIVKRGEEKIGRGPTLDLIKDYLKDINICISKENIQEHNWGVPQGSVLGLTLWNIFYDDVLGLSLPKGCDLMTYADDLELWVRAKKLPTLKEVTDRAIEVVREWMKANRVKLATYETETMVFHWGHRIAKDITFRHSNNIFGAEKIT